MTDSPVCPVKLPNPLNLLNLPDLPKSPSTH